MSNTSTVVTALGAVALFAAGLCADWLRSHLTAKAARDEREETRRTARKDRRDAFELDTLLQVQGAAQLLLRQTGRAHAHDEIHYLETGKWISDAPPLPDDIGGEGSLAAGNEFVKLIARVFDPGIRTLVADFNSARALASIGRPTGDDLTDDQAHDWAKAHMTSLAGIFIELQESIGKRIYELYEV